MSFREIVKIELGKNSTIETIFLSFVLVRPYKIDHLGYYAQKAKCLIV
jgi:hypothetical protein